MESGTSGQRTSRNCMKLLIPISPFDKFIADAHTASTDSQIPQIIYLAVLEHVFVLGVLSDGTTSF